MGFYPDINDLFGLKPGWLSRDSYYDLKVMAIKLARETR